MNVRMKAILPWVSLISLLTCGCALSGNLGLPLTPTPSREPAPTDYSSQTPSPSSTTTPAATVTFQSSRTPLPSDAAFAVLLEQLKLVDPKFDFTAFRLAYAETSDYDPYNFDKVALKESMYAAFSEHDYESALELADQILEQNYLLPDAHIIALQSYEELGRVQEADYHRYVIHGLAASILDSGDGKSPETAYIIVIIEEEYLILDVLGIKDASQGFFEDAGHAYDVFEGKDESANTPVAIYFNVDIPYQYLFDSLSP